MTKDFQIRVEAVIDVEDFAEELWREIEATPEFKQYGDRCRVRSAFFANRSADIIAIDNDIDELKPPCSKPTIILWHSKQFWRQSKNGAMQKKLHFITPTNNF